MIRSLRKLCPPLLLLVLALLALSAGIAGAAVPGVSPPALQPAGSGGVVAVERALAKLSTHKRLLVIGAHPDDEDTALLTLVARGMGGEAAYLSLSRGEGGQNLIGPELGVGLGLIRSRELLAAREVDGGRQYFTRAYDFGFTRSLDETLRLWPKEVLLEDAVRVIRRFKPQVVVSVFPPSPQAGHGQHQAAGAVAPEAFRLAGDPAALPGLAAEGLVPWTPEALYRAAWFDRASATMTLPLGRIDPLSGKSSYQLAMASRSMHRSQDMGRLQELGPQDDRVSWVTGGAGAAGKELFAGIDSHLAGIAGPLADEARRREVAAHLKAAEEAAVQARAKLSPDRPEEAARPLAEALRQLRAARALLAPEKTPEKVPAASADRAVGALIDEKIEVAEIGLAAALGIAVDASTDRETLTAGESFPVQAALWNGGGESLGGASVVLLPAPEWGDGALPPGESRDLAAGALSKWDLQANVPATASPTVPYFLRRPLQGSLYDWSQATPAERGEPFGPPPLTARFTFRWGDTEVSLDREVVHRHQDQAVGEVRRPLRVVPRVEVAVAEHLLAWPVQSHEPRRLPVTLTSRSRTPLSGRLELTVPGGASPWPAVPPLPFALEPGGEQSFEVVVKPPAGLVPGRYPLRLAFPTAVAPSWRCR